jgi:hypothetical protein
MKDADDYLTHVKTLIIANRLVVTLNILREESMGEDGLFRYQCILLNGEMLEVFERFQIENKTVQVTKYKDLSFSTSLKLF